MTSLHSRVKSSKIQAVKTGRGLQPPVSLRTEQVVNSAGWRDGQVLPPAEQAQTHRAGFRGFNPTMSGGKFSSGKLFKFSGCPEAKAEGAAATRRSAPESPASYPRASRSGAARLRPRARGTEGGPPAPPRRLLGLLAAALRPRHLLAETFRPRRCPASGWVESRAHSPRPTGHDGLGPRRARAPLGAPAPQPQPNGFRGVC